MNRLDQPLDRFIGVRLAAQLSKALALETVGDLLRHYPRRSQDRGELTPVDGLREGDQVTILAEVVSTLMRGTRNPKLSLREVVVTDGHHKLALPFFSRGGYAGADLKPGQRAAFSGQVRMFNRKLQLANPRYEVFEDFDDDAATQAAQAWARSRIPIYPLAGTVKNHEISRAVLAVLPLVDDVPEPLPPAVIERHGLLTWAAAVRGIHRPSSAEDDEASRYRLAFDEAMVLQVALARRRAESRRVPTKARAARPGGLVDQFRDRLPFTLTDGQRDADLALRTDLAEILPMHRLLQGEVGSGKTVVALLSMLAVVDSGGQAALLAPTEVLAQQHFRSITAMLGPLAEAGRLDGADEATRVALVTGSQATAARREALLDAASGRAGIVVGTHALLEDKVQFADLGLVVVDEQHRFGVHQRDALRAKGIHPPHLLVMTATPIPRTVAMTVFGDLEETALTELPAGRIAVSTHVVPADKPAYVERMWGRVRDEVAAGRQAYIVCPRIGDDGPEDELDPWGSEAEGATMPPGAAVLEVLPMLVDGPLAGLRVAALHGRMPPTDKDEVMIAFARGQVDVLVATTVIEVGIDVPNATVMVVLDAERFGMSQLHQLRGRVGRGFAPGWCLLHSSMPTESPSGQRLQAVAATTDGFALARLDLESRREGDVLGASQSGRRSTLKLLQLSRHDRLISDARAEASALVAADPALTRYPALADAVAALVDDERSEYLERA